MEAKLAVVCRSRANVFAQERKDCKSTLMGKKNPHQIMMRILKKNRSLLLLFI